jgi:NADPH:quinone reductase-like Zn-dependent oxidoreductase
LNSSEENFENELRVMAEKLGAKTCFEAIAGDFAGVILKNMPKNSVVTVYGCLSMKNLGNIDIGDMMFGNKVINTFMLAQWLKTKNQLSLLQIFYKVRSNISQNMKSVVAKKFKLEQFEEAIQFYLKNMSEGKVLFEPWSE